MLDHVHIFVAFLFFVVIYSTYVTFGHDKFEFLYLIKINLVEHKFKILFMSLFVSILLNGFDNTISYIFRDFTIGALLYIFAQYLKFTETDFKYNVYEYLKSKDKHIIDEADNLNKFIECSDKIKKEDQELFLFKNQEEKDKISNDLYNIYNKTIYKN